MRKKSKTDFVQLRGGLGNQLFQLAFGLYISGNKDLIMDSSAGIPRKNEVGLPELSSFKLPGRVSVVDLGNSKKYTRLSNMNLRLGLNPSNKLYVQVLRSLFSLALRLFVIFKTRSILRVQVASGVGFFEPNETSKNQLSVGYFQTYKWLERLDVLREMQNLTLLQKSALLSDFEKKANKQSPIVLHVRLGDYKSEKGIGILGKSYFEKSLDYLRDKSETKNVWVFSDEIDEAESMLCDIPGFNFEFVKDTWNSTALTFEIMRLGSHYIISNSTFSYWAAILARVEFPIVIAPSPWFIQAESPTELVPPTWIQLPRD